METKDNEQYSAPQNKPKPGKSGPQMPGDEREESIRSGANQEDQLAKLQPDTEDDKAPNNLGNPPDSQVDNGDR